MIERVRMTEQGKTEMFVKNNFEDGPLLYTLILGSIVICIVGMVNGDFDKRISFIFGAIIALLLQSHFIKYRLYIEDHNYKGNKIDEMFLPVDKISANSWKIAVEKQLIKSKRRRKKS
jgi:hypothetical protein